MKIIVNILTYEISVTIYLIELTFSGIREGVNKLAVLKFQSNPISLRKTFKNYGILGNQYHRHVLWSCEDKNKSIGS